MLFTGGIFEATASGADKLVKCHVGGEAVLTATIRDVDINRDNLLFEW